jgi:hypothetical protein
VPPNTSSGAIGRNRAPRDARETRATKSAGFTTMMSQLKSSNIRSAVLPMSSRLIPEREMAPMTTIAL